MHSRWLRRLTLFTSSGLLACSQVTIQTSLALGQAGSQKPLVQPATWSGWSKEKGLSTGYEDIADACESLALFRGGTSAGYQFTAYSPNGSPIGGACDHDNAFTEGDITQVYCDIPAGYYYFGQSRGVCLLVAAFQGDTTGPISGLVGLWDSTSTENPTQILIIWNPELNRYEGYLTGMSQAMKDVGFTLWEPIWTATPNAATGMLDGSLKSRNAENGASKETWQNSSYGFDSTAGQLKSASGETLLTIASVPASKGYTDTPLIAPAIPIGVAAYRTYRAYKAGSSALRALEKLVFNGATQSTTQFPSTPVDPPDSQSIAQASQISKQREKHILDGDKTGGGHGPGRNTPKKSNFPSSWSDQETLDKISDVVKDPKSNWNQLTSKPTGHTRYKVQGARDGTDIEVIVEPSGEGVITAYPTNITRNP